MCPQSQRIVRALALWFLVLFLVACEVTTSYAPITPDPLARTFPPPADVTPLSAPVVPTRMPAKPTLAPTPIPTRSHDYGIEHAAVTELPGEGDDRRARFEVTIVNSGGELGPAPLPVTMAIGNEDPRVIHVIERPSEGSVHYISPIADVGGGDHSATFSVAGKSRQLVFNVPAPDLEISLRPVSLAEGGRLLATVTVENIGDLRSHLSEVTGNWVKPPQGPGRAAPTRRIWGLDPGESKTFEFRIRPPPGKHRVTFRVRPFGYDQDLSNNTASTLVDAQLVPLDVVSASAYPAGWVTPQTGLVDIAVQVRNRGNHAANVPVGLVSASTIALSGQPKTVLAGLPRCENSLEEACWLELGQVELEAGTETTLSSRLTFPAGEHELIAFAGDPDRKLGWIGDRIQAFPLQVAAQPPTILHANLATRVRGYYSDGTAEVELTASLSNTGGQPLRGPVPLQLSCEPFDPQVSGCAGQRTLTLADGFGPDWTSTLIRIPMGREFTVRARFGELTQRSLRFAAPERILGVERTVWECYARRGWKQDGPDEYECSGFVWSDVYKWDPGRPVRIWPAGNAAYRSGLRSEMEKYCPLLNLECVLVDDEAAGNVKAYLGVPTSQAEEIGLSCEHALGCAVRSTSGAVVNGGKFVVWSREWLSDEGVVSVAAHELLHIIVPIGHRPTPGASANSLMDPFTEAILRLNAHPLIEPGMSLAQVRELVVLGDELLDPPGPSMQAIVFGAGAALYESESARFRVRGIPQNDTCRFPEFGWADQVHAWRLASEADDLIWHTEETGEYWYLNGTYWKREGEDWAKLDLASRAFEPWPPGTTSPWLAVAVASWPEGSTSLTLVGRANGQVTLAVAPIASGFWGGGGQRWKIERATLTISESDYAITSYRFEWSVDSACRYVVEGTQGQLRDEAPPTPEFINPEATGA